MRKFFKKVKALFTFDAGNNMRDATSTVREAVIGVFFVETLIFLCGAVLVFGALSVVFPAFGAILTALLAALGSVFIMGIVVLTVNKLSRYARG